MPYLAPLFALALAGASAPAPAAPLDCADLDFPVYFAHGAASVSGLARTVVAQAAGQIAACPVREIVLVPEQGLSESSARASELGDERARAVAAALTSAGVEPGLIRVGAPAPAAAASPLPARVTVRVVLAPPAAPLAAPGRYIAALAAPPSA